MVLFGLAGCSATNAEAGFGLPTLDAKQMQSVATVGGSTAETTFGTLIVESNGCFTFEDSSGSEASRAWIIWPDTARQEGDEVVLGSGARLGDGDSLSGRVAYVELSALPEAGNESSYFGSFGRFCDADASGVLLFTDVAP
jgi:hypothetical protein